jgi:hypothetical protein
MSLPTPFLPSIQRQQRVDDLLTEAKKAAPRGSEQDARRYTEEAYRASQVMFLYSRIIPGRPPELPGVSYMVFALANLA